MTEPVTVTLEGVDQSIVFTQTIPPGAFVLNDPDDQLSEFRFEGEGDGELKDVRIEAQGAGQFSFRIKGKKLEFGCCLAPATDADEDGEDEGGDDEDDGDDEDGDDDGNGEEEERTGTIILIVGGDVGKFDLAAGALLPFDTTAPVVTAAALLILFSSITLATPEMLHQLPDNEGSEMVSASNLAMSKRNVPLVAKVVARFSSDLKQMALFL